jgi:hypothetical protein
MGFRIYMLMPQTRPHLDRKLTPHLWIMGVVLLSTLVLTLRPQTITGAGYQCVLHAVFGVRCPFCGMTRDFAAMLHGHHPALNPCSWPAALVVYVVYPAAVLFAWRRNRLDWFHGRASQYSVLAALILMTVLNNLR